MLSGTPVIPEYVTVHLGPPDSDAANVKIPFIEYIQNVASSEIYPTWNENALRANIYVITSFVLNRIYTEWYRSRGYDFDITNSTHYDQKFIYQREIFENIRFLVSELFNDYVRRQGSVEPLFTAFCNGTTALCNGLSQWGTTELAAQGKTPYEILQYYYGNDIDIVKNAPVQSVEASYPGYVLKLGEADGSVKTIQVQLNRISGNFPAIPKIAQADGIYGADTEDAVRIFQEVNNLNATGEVNESTWYSISYIYTSVKRLAELDSEGLRLQEAESGLGETLQKGMSGDAVENIQYYLTVIGAYYAAVPNVQITGYFGDDTEKSVKAFQRVYGLEENGKVDNKTWGIIRRAYDGIVESVPTSDYIVQLYPNKVLREGMTDPSIAVMQKYLSKISEVYKNIPPVNSTGYFGPKTLESVIAFQKEFNLTAAGIVGAVTWDKIAEVYSDIVFGFDKRPYQAPGYVIK